ncbi:Mn2+/Fe2- transporter, NRAMP family protein [Haloferax mucosum ATCC BAA-1512]|uniref:Mn2+/Fe2-transporter, NRAMP family protein n=1 Tax=Haloferax mucosum ATCC BAA-1512 TaxID=662479 RepID=M0IGD2_9EURY|nr:divalent metal cation transporter [Haloferax mucosum]ELZ94489.1 Mn2+/Fe2- transporter, NRAMP family protein [Haloferax mucosum ATCC BAA-1512]
MGPAWVAGAIAIGPATMASVITAGATFGYTLLWVVVLSAFLGASAQYLSMRLGLLTEAGIATVVEQHLGETWAWILVIDAVLAAGLAQLVIMKGLADVSATVTGIDARIWGVTWAVVLAVGLVGRGYRFIEYTAKLLVSLVIVAFVASLFLVPIDPTAAAEGLVPRIPAGVDGALVAAGILGGAVHITLITMHSYTMRAREWTARDYGLATFDVGVSMLVAFGVYSLVIFLVAAAVLHSPTIAAGDLSAVTAAQALGPLVGSNAKWLFLLGLWGAAVSTLGGNTIVPPYLVADKLGWGTDVSDSRYRALLAAVALLSGLGAFAGGAFFPLLVLVLAFGLVGTPFAIAVVLYLLNSDAVPEPNSTAANLGGIALLTVTTVLAANFVRSRALSDLGDPISVFIVVFAALLGVAMLSLGGKFVREAI